MFILGVDPDTKNTAFALLYASALCRKGMYKPTIVWTDVASVDAKRSVETRIQLMLTRLDDTIGNLCYDLPDGPPKLSLAIVESQEKYPRDKVRPNDLIHLAQVAGMAAAFIAAHHEIRPYIVLPRTWKGQVPKKIHQQRVLSNLIIGQTCDYMDLNKTQQGHVIDAMGLAVWGLQAHNIGVLS